MIRARTLKFAVPQTNKTRHLVGRWNSTKLLVVKAWRFSEKDLWDTTDCVHALIAGRTYQLVDKTDYECLMTHPLDELWMLFATEAAPGTRLWMKMWEKRSLMQRLTIADVLIVFASIKLRLAAERLRARFRKNDKANPQMAALLAAEHIDAAAEALRLAQGFTPSPKKSSAMASK